LQGKIIVIGAVGTFGHDDEPIMDVLLLKHPQLALDYLDAQFVEERSQLSFRYAVFLSDLKADGTGHAAVFSPLFDGLDYLCTLHCSS
jgi:hypothetical protein